jgi:hypothetical protein
MKNDQELLALVGGEDLDGDIRETVVGAARYIFQSSYGCKIFFKYYLIAALGLAGIGFAKHTFDRKDKNADPVVALAGLLSATTLIGAVRFKAKEVAHLRTIDILRDHVHDGFITHDQCEKQINYLLK